MPFLPTIKTPLLCLVLAVAYSNMVIDIIQIVKVRTGENTYPPAVVAMLVCSILQLVYLVSILATGGRGTLNRARNVAGVIGVLLLFNLASIIAVTALRHHDRYCGSSNTIRSDCAGVLRGVEGLGFTLVGFNLIYLGVLSGLVGYGSWNDPLADLPPKARPQTDIEKAPAH